MSNNFYIERDAFNTFALLACTLESKDKSKKGHSMRFYVTAKDQEVTLQTNCNLLPGQITARLACEHHMKSSLDVEFKIDAISNNLSALPATSFLQLTVEDRFLQLQAATFSGGLLDDGDSKYLAINTNSKNQVRIQSTELLTDYLLESSDHQQQIHKFYCREIQLIIFQDIYRLMASSNKPADSRVILTSDENAMYIELQAVDTYARFKLFEIEEDCQINISLDKNQFKFLKNSMSILMHSKINAVEFLCSGQSLLLLRCGTICCDFKNLTKDLLFTAPEPLHTDGWCEETNDNLKTALSLINVASRTIDDMVIIHVRNGEIHAEVKTDHSNAEFCSKMKLLETEVSGPAFVLNRSQLENSLRCFNTYDILKLHGLLSPSSRLIIKSSFNDDIVMLSITEPLEC